MSEFNIFFSIGFGHLLEVGAADHILFIVVLVATYRPRQWREVALLATAFTVGHSITLALSTLDILSVPSEIAEILIALSIVVTAWWNLRRPPEFRKNRKSLYWIAAGFGLVHGIGYAGQIKPMLMPDMSLWKPLLAFNIGLEVAQLVVVSVLLLIGWIIIDLIGISLRKWTLVLSFFAGTYATILLIIRILDLF
ncbi:MAG: HupE/UreJ family protein [Bacteroidia bacterium]